MRQTLSEWQTIRKPQYRVFRQPVSSCFVCLCVPTVRIVSSGRFAAKAGGVYAAHEVTTCPGTQAALAAAFRALAQPGGPVLLESPTYPGAILVCDADPSYVMRAVLRFVEQGDREILDRDTALATLVRQELVTADAVTPCSRAR